ncbi:TniQ family protein [Mycolicibacterium phocaicum]|uniref:TniQ protein n=1 Tax=Mycolicibacterium phocaicum TaxID=319706 RepID=A0AA94R7H7_9MYCO|nr:TniQ family protein [Mycolicibacterium phocaicum]TLH63694.1 hypothetical protein C1S79_21210 [Mycolicibacterium phocaicum]
MTAVSVRWPEPAVRALPRPVTAFQFETVHSFITRLAHANHVAPQDLRGYAARPGDYYPNTERLGLLSGYPPAVLLNRLRGLRPDERDATRQRARSRPACRWCCARRGVNEPVHCWFPDHVTACYRHYRWIGPSANTWDDQVSLTGHHGVIAAARRHARLHRLHHPDIIEAALNDALRIVMRQRRLDGQPECDITNASPSARWATAKDVRTHLTTYPQVITVAGAIIAHRPLLLNAGNENLVIAAFLARAYMAFHPKTDSVEEALRCWLYDQQIIRRSRHGARNG